MWAVSETRTRQFVARSVKIVTSSDERHLNLLSWYFLPIKTPLCLPYPESKHCSFDKSGSEVYRCNRTHIRSSALALVLLRMHAGTSMPGCQRRPGVEVGRKDSLASKEAGGRRLEP